MREEFGHLGLFRIGVPYMGLVYSIPRPDVRNGGVVVSVDSSLSS